jgi:hypothetical protein
MMGFGERARLAAAISFSAVAVTIGGCASVFGIDDPTECPNGTCGPTTQEAGSFPTFDGTLPDLNAPPIVDATLGDGDATGDAITDAGPADAPPDQTGPTGVRCGSSGLRCTGATPLCCAVLIDGGSKYGCVSSASSCSTSGTDYAIECATSTDCLHSASGRACCHFGSHIGCDPPTVCPSATVCDPGVDGSCDAGQTCSVTFAIEGYLSPYFMCGP